ncbi:MAG: cellulose binding domain-containing protein, partial [Planctomycetota bacterium]
MSAHLTRRRHASRSLGFESLENRVALDASYVAPALAENVGSADAQAGQVRSPDAGSRGGLEFGVVSQWGSGFTGDFQVMNNGSDLWSGWTVSFDADFAITSIWNGSVVSR